MAEGGDDMRIEWKHLEAGRARDHGLLDPNCEKLAFVREHHERMLTVEEACALADDANEAPEDVVARYQRALTLGDVSILRGYNGGELRKITDAVVMIEVSIGKDLFVGTGFLVKGPGNPEYAVLGKPGYAIPGKLEYAVPGEPLYAVPGKPGYAVPAEQEYTVLGKPENVVPGEPEYAVLGKPENTVPSEPEYAVLTNLPVKREDGSTVTMAKEDIKVIFFYDSAEADFVTCDVLEISPYSLPIGDDNGPDQDHLDFAMLFLKFPDNLDDRARLTAITPLHPENRELVDLPGYNNRLVVIGHPHRAYKQIAFGDFNNQEVIQGGHRIVNHGVATCKGSSGSPFLHVLVNKETNEANHNLCSLHFCIGLHFRGGRNIGSAISIISICQEIGNVLENQAN